jgi:hypothetical protein
MVTDLTRLDAPADVEGEDVKVLVGPLQAQTK